MTLAGTEICDAESSVDLKAEGNHTADSREGASQDTEANDTPHPCAATSRRLKIPWVQQASAYAACRPSLSDVIAFGETGTCDAETHAAGDWQVDR